MEFTVSQFRAKLFDALEQAKAGTPIIVKHRGTRYKIVPEARASKFAKVTKRPGVILKPLDPEESVWNESEWRRANEHLH